MPILFHPSFSDLSPELHPATDPRLIADFEHLRVRTSAPLCYSREAADNIDQARMDEQSSGVLVALSVVTCAAAFVVVYAGWGL